MNIKLLFAILATVLTVVGFFPYFRDISRKKTKPHAYTWLIWTITQGTATASMWYGKGGWGVSAFTVGTVLIFVVFLLSLKFGTKNITKGDTVIFMAALLAIIIWWQLHNPILAVLMASVIDIVGYFPSFRKTYEEPWTETPATWAIFALTSIFTVFALTEYNFLTLSYLTAITAANICFLVLCLTRRRVIPPGRPATSR